MDPPRMPAALAAELTSTEVSLKSTPAEAPPKRKKPMMVDINQLADLQARPQDFEKAYMDLIHRIEQLSVPAPPRRVGLLVSAALSALF